MILDKASMENMDQFSKISSQHENLFTQIDNLNDIRVQNEDQKKQYSPPKHDQHEPLEVPEDLEEVPPSQAVDLEASQKSVRSLNRNTPPMPSEDRMRHSIADSLMEILANMTNPLCQRQCFELLQVKDPLQARCRILAELQKIDESRSNP